MAKSPLIDSRVERAALPPLTVSDVAGRCTSPLGRSFAWAVGRSNVLVGRKETQLRRPMERFSVGRPAGQSVNNVITRSKVSVSSDSLRAVDRRRDNLSSHRSQMLPPTSR